MYYMAAIGVRHANAVRALNRILNRQVGTIAVVDVQDPIRLDDESMPQPDLIVLRDRDYPMFPTPADVFIIIEVADTSLDYDRGVKLPRYAAARISEAWLVDLNANVIERHCDPRDGIYQQLSIVRVGEVITSTVLPEIAIPVSTVLGTTGQSQ
jgi:Uma2 family endonuclease